jgi:hypothetical protein
MILNPLRSALPAINRQSRSFATSSMSRVPLLITPKQLAALPKVGLDIFPFHPLLIKLSKTETNLCESLRLAFNCSMTAFRPYSTMYPKSTDIPDNPVI